MIWWTLFCKSFHFLTWLCQRLGISFSSFQAYCGPMFQSSTSSGRWVAWRRRYTYGVHFKFIFNFIHPDLAKATGTFIVLRVVDSSSDLHIINFMLFMNLFTYRRSEMVHSPHRRKILYQFQIRDLGITVTGWPYLPHGLRFNGFRLELLGLWRARFSLVFKLFLKQTTHVKT